MGYLKRPPSIKKIKYQSWYLTTCCGLEVQKPTQALKSVKGPGNTFDWNSKWSGTVPSLIYFSWDIYRWVSAPQAHSRVSNINIDIRFFYMEVGSLWIFHEQYIKDGKVLAHLGCQSKVLPGPLTDWSASVGFCTSSPQQVVKYQLWYLKFFLWRGAL
jgi:hypothetical protein